MKKYFLIFLFCGLFFIMSLTIFSCSTLAATYNYYFSKIGGGTACTEESPCKTLSVAQNKIEFAKSTDIVNLYFKRGDEWGIGNTAEKYINYTFGLNISSDDPIVNIDAYGNGEKPVFDGEITNFDTAPDTDRINGPSDLNSVFRFYKSNCSVKNIEIKNSYCNVITLINAGETGFTLSNCYIHNFGNSGIFVNNGAIDVTVEYCTMHTGQELYRAGKRSTWSGAITLKKEHGTKPSGNVVRYNVVYDVYGEGINVANAIVEYNVVGDTGSVGICTVPHDWDFEQNIVRYNLIVMSDWDSSIYDNMPGSSPSGIRVFDEQVGGYNLKCDVQYYGNIIINRSRGIWVFQSKQREPFGPIKIYNNTIIDSHNENILIANPDYFTDVKIYNNAFILYDSDLIAAGAKLTLDQGDFLPDSRYTIDNNAFWTGGGYPVVDDDWKENYITIDPKLPGKAWTKQKGTYYYFGISFPDIFPPLDSGLVGTGKILGSSYNSSFLTYGTDFSTLTKKATFQKYSNSKCIGAIARESLTLNSENPIHLNSASLIPSKINGLHISETK